MKLSFAQGWKTVVFNVIMAIIAGVKIVNPDAEQPDAAAVQGALDVSNEALLAITAVGNVILRAFTSSPIFKKKEG